MLITGLSGGVGASPHILMLQVSLQTGVLKMLVRSSEAPLLRVFSSQTFFVASAFMVFNNQLNVALLTGLETSTNPLETIHH